MPTAAERPVTTFILVPERDLGHAIARKLREDPRVRVCGISSDADADVFRIWESNPDVIVGDWKAGGLEFLFTERLPPGEHRIVFLAPRSDSGCDACYEALVRGADGIMCRPSGAADLAHCDGLVRSILDGTPLRPADCPAVERLRRERTDAAPR